MANETTIIARICLRQGDNTYCNQFNGDKLLLEGEPLFNTSTNVLKIGKKRLSKFIRNGSIYVMSFKRIWNSNSKIIWI